MIKRIRLFHYFLLIVFCFMVIFSCTPSTETSKGSLKGTINLEGESNHSGITIALYDLAILDPDIVSINQEYPQIGVQISQHTEFDHRLQSPVKFTETDAEGSFEITKIPTGIYNLVIINDGWGFKYLYNVDISKGDNEISQARCHPEPVEGRSEISEFTPNPSLQTNRGEMKEKARKAPLRKGKNKGVNLRTDILLFPEQHITGNIQEEITVETDHHLIIDDDTALVPGIHFTIQPGAVIRINPGVNLTINGVLTAQGEENNMFWVTSNDGFEESLTKFDSLQCYGQMELSAITTVKDNLLEWGRFNWGLTCLVNDVENMFLENNYFSFGSSGFINNSINCMFTNCIVKEFYTRAIETFANASFLKCIALDNKDAFRVFLCNGLIQNNYFLNNYISVRPFYGETEVINNCFVNGEIHISPTASSPLISYNDFNSNNISTIGIEFNKQHIDYCSPIITNNNFYNNGSIVISLIGWNSYYGGGTCVFPGADEDFVLGLNYIMSINENTFYDAEDYDIPSWPEYIVIVEDIASSPINNTGIIN